MDPLRIHAYKIHAIKKHKRLQFVSTILLYSLSTLACALLCSSPLWYPPFCATFNVIFFLSLPKICSFFFTSKVLFVVGNLIVIFLVGESKFFVSKSNASSSDISNYDNKYECRKSPKPQVLVAKKVWRVTKGSSESQSHDEEKRVERKWEEDMLKHCKGDTRIFVEDLKREEDEILPAEQLNKLADDFIARINRQRRLEVECNT